MEDQNNNGEREGGKPSLPKFNITWVYVFIGVSLLLMYIMKMFDTSSAEISMNSFVSIAKQGDVSDLVEVERGKLVHVYVSDAAILRDSAAYSALARIKSKSSRPDARYYSLNINSEFQESVLSEVNKSLKTANKPELTVTIKDNSSIFGDVILPLLLPALIFIGIWMLLMRRMGGGSGPGSQIFNIGKSKATLFDQNTKVNTTFADVAGLDEAKEEVVEVVDFLKNPKKYTTLGGKIPKGVLLVGPPGTGKTLLAKAVAGEANAPFFSISGSDFVEMFVGVGASRVRDLFRQAREKAPCIIFIDEIDAIGRARGRGSVQGGNDERENTLNQLLVEMDGFPTDKGVILMAATNRPDILDQALLRPGRFDRQIGIGRPDLKGREQIFSVHLKNIKIDDVISAAQLAEMTPGFVGADIANICNEAALIAARRSKTKIDIDDFNYALDRVIGGLEKKNKIISPEEKEIIAYHEAGHAICGWFLEHAHPLVKVTIVPRGLAALGYAQYLPKEQYITRTEKLLDDMCMTLGGRAAERVVFDKISTGAQSDLETVTKMGYDMVLNYGLNEKVGNVSYYAMLNESYTKPFSEQTSFVVDQEVRKMIEEQYERAQKLLIDKRPQLDLLANTLLTKEVLHKADLEQMLGKRRESDVHTAVVPQAIVSETLVPVPSNITSSLESPLSGADLNGDAL
jgi:AFG3 family protein